MLETHLVGSLTEAMIFAASIASSSCLTDPCSEIGNLQGGCTTGKTSLLVYIVYPPDNSPIPLKTSLKFLRTLICLRIAPLALLIVVSLCELCHYLGF